jgi:pimeloyl-ACP methyl ester carboxylesterase
VRVLDATISAAILDARVLARPPRLGDDESTRTIDLPQASLRVRIVGRGRPTVVFAPDPPNVIEHYEPLIDRLSARTTVVVYELPGFGFSRARAGFHFSVADNAATLIALLERLEAAPYALAVPCAAGLAALDVARRRPRLVSHVAAVQTPSWAEETRWIERIDRRRLIATPVVGQLLVRALRGRVARAWYRAAAADAASAAALTDVAERAFARGATFALASALQGVRASVPPSTAPLAQPALLVWGARDRSHRKSDPRSLLPGFERAQLVEFAEAGHFPDLECPDRFCDELLRLLVRG